MACALRLYYPKTIINFALRGLNHITCNFHVSLPAWKVLLIILFSIIENVIAIGIAMNV